MQRIEQLLAHKHLAGGSELTARIRILPRARRATDLDGFRRTAAALAARKRLRIIYHGRERDQTTERTDSPQRLIYYRDNWYLDAWCHLRNALRSFALDRLHAIATLDEPERQVSEKTLDTHYTHAYGIFAGPARHTGILRFTSEAAKWVADEHWHPAQQGRVQDDGIYELRIPYGEPRELIMDIMKYGPEVEVLAPPALRDEVRERLRRALRGHGEE